MTFPKNLNDSKNFTVKVDSYKINLFDFINYCDYIVLPQKEYHDVVREKLHGLLFSQVGKDRLTEKMNDGMFGKELSSFNEDLDSVICDALACPMGHGSLNRDNECFNCDFKIKTHKELFNSIIVNLLDKIEQNQKY